MKLDPRQQIAGHDARAIRDLLKRQDDLTVEYVQKTLDISSSEASKTIDGLLAVGYLEGDSRGFHPVTPAGRQVGNASFAKRMPRSRADQLLRDLLVRAAEINVRTDLTHRVGQINIFGSYLSDTPDLGDLDVAVRLEVREEYADTFVDVSVSKAQASGRRLSMVAQLGFSELEVLEILKSGQRAVSLHNFSELGQLNTPNERVFP